MTRTTGTRTTGTAASRPWWALVVAVIAMVSAATMIAAVPAAPGGEADHDEAPMLQVAPGGEVELASLSPDLQEVYEAAAADHEAFTQVRCYCGCEAFLGHRHLLDCFERPEGGWEAHAVGCGICIAEADEVVERRAQNVPMDQIVGHIDDRYGAITGA